MLRLRIRRNRALAERSDALSERNNSLSEMNATKDKFFSIISHDLRNPVVAQRDALQMLVQNSGSWDVNTLTTYYHELLKSADGQVELIYNLLGWAQLQTGRITYNPSTFNLAHRLRSDIALIRNIAEKKGVGFAVSIPDDADIIGDGAMLSIVVRNLLTNAVKFTKGASPPDTPNGKVGTVTLNVTPIDGGDDTRRDAMHCVSTTSIITGYIIAISDTGIGMSAEQIGNLFRLDSARSRKGTAGEQGSGLGLIVCRELLEKHGSELHVESEEGKGSRFWFKV
jgi:signal transduction histidine kinase